MRTILIAGGAGFIGSHLADSLLRNKDVKVVCFDNLSTGSKKNIEHLFGNEQFEFREGDLINPLDFGKTKFSEIYNLACPASPLHYQANPIGTIKVNTIGMIHV